MTNNRHQTIHDTYYCCKNVCFLFLLNLQSELRVSIIGQNYQLKSSVSTIIQNCTSECICNREHQFVPGSSHFDYESKLIYIFEPETIGISHLY